MESPLEYPQPPSDGDQHGLPRRAGTDPDGDRWNWRIRWRKDELVRRIVIIHLNRNHTQKSSSSTISSTPSHHSVSNESKTFIICILR